MYGKELTAVDSIQLDNTYAKFKLTGEPNTLNIPKKIIDSITYARRIQRSLLPTEKYIYKSLSRLKKS